MSPEKSLVKVSRTIPPYRSLTINVDSAIPLFGRKFLRSVDGSCFDPDSDHHKIVLVNERFPISPHIQLVGSRLARKMI